MKLKISILRLLCLLFLKAGAQDYTTHNVISNNSSTRDLGAGGIHIGQQVPDALITGVNNLTIAGKDRASFKLSELRGKLVILDFWATWCAPCRAMVPIMDSLQRVFGDRMLFLPVGYESQRTLAPVLAQLQKIKPFNLPEVSADQVLNRLFPHRSLPHYVWIDSEGKVVAITEEKEITGRNIRRMLTSGNIGTGSDPAMAEKKDLQTPYNSSLPLLLNGNGGDGRSMQYHSILTGYIPGLGSGLRVTPLDPLRGQQFTLRNVPFVTLCGMAYSDGGRYIMACCFKLLSKDSSRMTSPLSGQAYRDWQMAGNGWCYELLVPPASAGQAFGMIREDIRRLFPQYSVNLEPQVTRCLALVRTSEVDKVKSAGGQSELSITPYGATLHNASIYALMQRLKMQYLQNSRLPVIDLTGYKGRIDMDLEAKLYDVTSLNAALAKYDLAFVEKVAPVDMIVIRDAPISNTP